MPSAARSTNRPRSATSRPAANQDQNADLLHYLYESRALESAYHNHKETLAWAGVTLYLAAMAAISAKHGKHLSQSARIGEVLALFVGFFVVLAYVRRQFNLREWAARLSYAYELLILEVLGDAPPRDPKFRVDDQPRGIASRRLSGFPIAVRELFFPSRLRAANEQAVLHRRVRDLVPTSNWDSRPVSFERLTYFLMFLATTIVAALLARK